MKFHIKRSSLWKNEKPCEGVYEEEYVHKILNGTETPNLENRKRWVLEINSLEDLVKFKDEQGTVILCYSFDHQDNILSLEIYDDYIE
jgi:hypothetical protein